MSPGVAVVTDSTATLTDVVCDKYGVSVVPLQVVLGHRVGAEGIDVTPADVAAALAAKSVVSTSRPSPHTFAETYRRLAEEGAREIVSIHLSAGLSGTLDAARVAAADAELPVHLVDSQSTAMGLGFPVLAAAEVVAAHASAADAVHAAEQAIQRTRVLFYVDSLDALRRGGRIGQAAALVGGALLVKPILHVDGGRIALLEKVRTTTKALDRLEDLAVVTAGAELVDVAVHHLAAPQRAQEVADRLRGRLRRLRSVHVTEVGAVVGAHVGSGLIGVVVHRP
jgi:DegV family protein with EDD domain